MKRNNLKKIILSGGGTGGSATPLLAVAEDLRRVEPEKYQFLFVGTFSGPEKMLAAKDGLQFKALISGKWRRYFSFKNILDLFKILLAFGQSFIILLSFRPQLIMSAGGFVSVPLVWAAWVLHIPVIIHQQDIRPGLANRLMAPLAKVVTVTFAKSLKDYGAKAVLVGNPLKDYWALSSDSSFSATAQKFNLSTTKPLVFIIGGGTGSLFINNLLRESRERLVNFCQIIHITGHSQDREDLVSRPDFSYQAFPFLDHSDILGIMKGATVVVSRCGLGALTELSALGKPSVLIPMPHSHQEDNAQIFAQSKAAIVLSEDNLTLEAFVTVLKEILSNEKRRNELHRLIKEVVRIGNEEMVKVVQSFF